MQGLDIIKAFWPLWVLLAVVGIIRIVIDVLLPELKNRRRFKEGEKWRSDRELLQWLSSMKPTEFENYIAELFFRLGYKAKATGGSHDKGIDVVAEKNGITSYIQCKKYITSEVTVGAVRDFYGALADHLANGKGYFITTNKFTLDAEIFAKDKPIELIDGPGLVKYIKMAKKDTDKEMEVSSTKCPHCRGNLINKSGKYGKFIGCSNYPKCRYTKSV